MPESPASDIYAHDQDAASDDRFEPGGLRHLVPQNRGRMLDPRRTPITVIGVDRDRGFFEVVVRAFEDAGAHWHLPIEEVSHFQFDRGSEALAEKDVQDLERLVKLFDRQIQIPARPEGRSCTLRTLEEEQVAVRRELAGEDSLAAIDLDECIRTRRGSDQAAAAINRLLEAAGVAELDRVLSEGYVSNPHSGEVVKGHAIVIAEMGLCPYVGNTVRDERLFLGDGSREHRRRHILLRMAFVRELMALLGVTSVELFRGMAMAGAIGPFGTSPLVAATFSREVATSHFDSTADVAVLTRQRVPVSRLFMTFLETPAMNRQYKEAEAVLIGDPENHVF